jgi:hypothetical protein
MRSKLVALGAFVALGALTAFAFSGCNKEAPPTAEQPKAPDAEVRPASAAAGPAAPATPAAPAGDSPTPPTAGEKAASSRVTESQFEVAIAPSGAYQAGKEGTVEIVLQAKAPFHVNDQYPIKFKVKEGPGVKYAAAVVGKDKAKVEQMKATMPVLFVPEAAGKHSVGGQLSFSVCTEENCLMEKRDLSVVVDVK